MFVVVPYKADAPIAWQPIANYLIIAVTVCAFLLFRYAGVDAPTWMFLYDWGLPGLPGHMLLHGNWAHLVGNMLFLYVFGNAVCSRIGNGKYTIIYILSGMLAGVSHMSFSDLPAIGASGAVSAIVGMYFCLFPRTNVSMFFLIFYRGGVFAMRSLWIISIWFVLDLLGSFWGSDGIAYHAHVAGYLAGFIAIAILLKMDRVPLFDGERPLISPPSRKKKQVGPEPKPREVEPFVRSKPEIPTPTKPRKAKRPPSAAPGAIEASSAMPEMPDKQEEKKESVGLRIPDPGAADFEKTADGYRFNCACGKTFEVSKRTAKNLFLCPSCFKEQSIPEMLEKL